MTLDRKQIGELKISTSHNKFIKFAWLAIADIFQLDPFKLQQSQYLLPLFIFCVRIWEYVYQKLFLLCLYLIHKLIFFAVWPCASCHM